MELKKIPDNITGFLKKYRYVVLILVIGLILMAIPGKTVSSQQNKEPIEAAEAAKSVSEELSEILSQISGAGKVRVMLTVASGAKTIYQTNDDHSTASDTASTKVTTVTVTDADRNETGLVTQVIPEKYLGAIIICQGADSSSVRLAIVEAVADVTGLGTDRICVLKMK